MSEKNVLTVSSRIKLHTQITRNVKYTQITQNVKLKNFATTLK